MSSVHFEVENFGNRTEVRDLESTNRTWLNNNHISAADLKQGDRLRAGKTILAVEIDYSISPAVSDGPSQPSSMESNGQAILPPAVAAQLPLQSPTPLPVLATRNPIDPLTAADQSPSLRPAHSAQATPVGKPPLIVATPIQPVNSVPAPPVIGRVSSDVQQGRRESVPVPPHPAALPAQGAAPSQGEQISAPVPPPVRPPSEPVKIASKLEVRESPGANLSRVNARVSDAFVQAPTPPKRSGNSPIESVSFADAAAMASSRDRPNQGDRGRVSDNPIQESSSLYFDPATLSVGDKRRFRQYERVGDFQTLYNLRNIVTALNQRKSIRVVCHFNKIRMTAPAMSNIVPLFPELPGALTHLPISMTYREWESETVQCVAMRLCTSDALIVIVGEFNTDLDTALQSIAADGIPGFCEPGGFFGWCWPSAFLSLMQSHGSKRWGEILGVAIEGAIMYNPIHSEVLVAFAAESLEAELKPLGFKELV